MLLALVTPNGSIARYPHSFEDLRKDHPQVSFPRELRDELLTEFGAVRIRKTEKPEPVDPITHFVEETTPTLVDGVWTQTWANVERPADEVAVRRQNENDRNQRAALKEDAFVSQFVAMTPAEIATYINNEVTNITSAKVMLTRLAQMMLTMTRREFR